MTAEMYRSHIVQFLAQFHQNIFNQTKYVQRIEMS